MGASSGNNSSPHVTTGVGTLAYLDEMLAEPFEAFTFSPQGAAIYQLGTWHRTEATEGTAVYPVETVLQAPDSESIRV